MMSAARTAGSSSARDLTITSPAGVTPTPNGTSSTSKHVGEAFPCRRSPTPRTALFFPSSCVERWRPRRSSPCPPSDPNRASTGLLAMLDKDEAELKSFALTKLNACADFWAEISESLPDIESLYEDESFPRVRSPRSSPPRSTTTSASCRTLCPFALGARELFDVDEPSEYVETLLSKAIDEYCAGFVARSEQQIKAEAGEARRSRAPIDKRLIELVERMIESSMSKLAHQSVMGIALEARRLDMIERVLRVCDTAPGEGEHEQSACSAMLAYTFTLATQARARRLSWRRRTSASRDAQRAPPSCRSCASTRGHC